MGIGVFVLMVVDVPGLSFSTWAPKSGVLLILGAAGLPVLVFRAIGRDRPAAGRGVQAAAIAAIAFVVVALASALSSSAVTSSVVGLYNQGTGFVFILSIAGAWALATTVGDTGRPFFEQAIIVAAVVNSVVAILQETVGLQSTVPLYGNEATGLMGNPIYLGSLCVGAFALLGGRFAEKPRQWWLPVVLVGGGVGVSSERLPALMLVAVCTVEVVVMFRRRRATNSPAKPIAIFVVLGFGSLVAGTLLGTVIGKGNFGVIGRTAGANAQGTFGDRIDIWRTALTAIGHRPWLGYGPGQLRDATTPYVSLSLARSQGFQVFTDAHNFFVEYATTTGLLGLAAVVTWLVLAARNRRGRLVVCAAVVFAIGLAEPLNVTTAPLVVMALGAARIGPPRSLRDAVPRNISESWSGRAGVPGGRAGRVAVGVCAAIAGVLGVALTVGDIGYAKATTLSTTGSQIAAISRAQSADRVLFPWPDPLTLMAKAEVIQGFGATHQQAETAIPWAREALNRDPTSAELWGNLALLQYDAGDLGAAEQSALRSHAFFPYYVPALNTLGFIARSRGDTAEARQWFGRSLAVEPTQAVIRDLYTRGCVPKSKIGLIPPSERCP